MKIIKARKQGKWEMYGRTEKLEDKFWIAKISTHLMTEKLTYIM